MDDVTPFPNAFAVGGGAPSTVTSAAESGEISPATAGCSEMVPAGSWFGV